MLIFRFSNRRKYFAFGDVFCGNVHENVVGNFYHSFK